MRQGRRYGLSAEQKADIWQRWKAGESLHEIGRAFGKDHGSIQFLLAQHGGIAPTVRRRSRRTLTLAEREEISRGIASGSSIREIARGLERAASTVSREVARHGGRPVYRASDADQQAWTFALRPKACLLAGQRKLRLIVAMVRSSMPFPSASGRRRSKTAPSLVIGKAICSQAPGTVTSPPSWNGIRVSSSWLKRRVKTQRRSSPR
jgi:Helix-turn-helix domain